ERKPVARPSAPEYAEAATRVAPMPTPRRAPGPPPRLAIADCLPARGGAGGRVLLPQARPFEGGDRVIRAAGGTTAVAGGDVRQSVDDHPHDGDRREEQPAEQGASRDQREREQLVHQRRRNEQEHGGESSGAAVRCAPRLEHLAASV